MKVNSAEDAKRLATQFLKEQEIEVERIISILPPTKTHKYWQLDIIDKKPSGVIRDPDNIFINVDEETGDVSFVYHL